MDLEAARALKKAADELEVELEIREGYSGRGMYGKETTAVVVGRVTDLISLATHAALSLEQGGHSFRADSLVGLLSELSVDNMGRTDVIVY